MNGRFFGGIMPRIDMVRTGARISALRKERNVTVNNIVDVLGVSSQAVFKWQRGEALPTVDNLVILADLLNVRIDEILVITR